MVAVSFPTQQTILTPGLVATIEGSPLTALSAQTQHGVNRDIGTATVTMVPPPSTVDQLRDRWLNRPVEVQAGYAEFGGALRIFTGRVESIDRDFDGCRVSCTGWAKLLDFPAEEDIVFPGGTQLYEIVRSLCQLRKVPLFGGDRITRVNGVTPIRLGGVSYFDEGKIVIPKRTSPLQWMTSTLDLFGYSAFDRPDGFFWWQRVSGSPTGTAIELFAQGANLLSASRSDSLSQMATWIDVTGASGTDDDGIAVKIRSFPAVVPPDTGGFVSPPGFRRIPVSSNLLVTQALADDVRNVAEINLARPHETESWRFRGDNRIQPGNVVDLTSDKLELNASRRWVMSVDHTVSSQGIRTSWTGWAGGGTPLPGGDDAQTIAVVTGPVHLGDEYLAHYAQPSPQGKERAFDITVPDEYTAIVLSGKAHGCNSYLFGGTNSESEVSKLEVWQGAGDKAVGTGTLPTLPENLNQALAYTNLANWITFRIPVPGQLKAGLATVKIVAGEDSRIGAAFKIDDFEIRDLVITLTGVGYPILPTGGS